MNTVNKKTLCAVTMLFSMMAIFSQSEAPVQKEASLEESEKAFSIIKESQNQLVYKGDYSCTVSLIVEKPGKPKENLQYKFFERIGKDLFTMVQIFPEADKGNGYLRDGDNIWSYDPISRKFSHSSLKDALADSDLNVDDMSNEDDQYRKNYKVRSITESTLGKYPVYVIELEAITSKPAYKLSTLYIRTDVPLVLKRADFSATGRLMRTTLIPKYAKTEKGYVGYQIIMKDELNPGEQTQQIISELTFDTLPDTIFTKAYLEGLN